ncbi:MAG: deoxyribodipyrimidine photo-lyase [Chitinophagaceae bacterium]
MRPAVNLFWFRRDLRLEDNAGLFQALKEGLPVVPVFIFDRNILDELVEDETGERPDARVAFIHDTVCRIGAQLAAMGAAIEVRYGFPEEIFRQLIAAYQVAKVFANHDYEPYAITRDAAIQALLAEAGISFHTYKDQVIAEKNEVTKDDGKPYTVFTPYSRRWKAFVTPAQLASYPSEKHVARFFRQEQPPIPSLSSMRFAPAGEPFPSAEWEPGQIRQYTKQRDIPAVRGTSRLGVHLRFGTISIRRLAREAGSLDAQFLNELIWREFYQMILWHFPQVVGHAFKPAYDNIQWRNNEKEFNAWCQGQTGYPIVDAGMRELNETGFMHNRIRMVTASFLTKHLLIDWRWGEAYFAGRLLDFDLAANNGGWQWAAGSGCDAAPYFRIFNPYLQTKKFDPHLDYVRKWVPELDELTYPRPIVDHELARARCLEVYSKALKK